MKIIQKYITKELIYSTTIAIIIFTFFLIMNSLFVLSDLVIKYGVKLLNVIKLLTFLLPSTLAITIPMAVLVGVILTYSRLVQDNEFIGMQACGINLKIIILPAIYLSIILTIFLFWFNSYVLPEANLSYKKLYYNIVKKRSNILLQEHTFIDEFDNYVFYIGEKDNANNLLKNIIVFIKKKSKDDATKVILAKEGELISDEQTFRIALKLKKGVVQIASYKDPYKLNSIFFDTNYIDLDIKGVLRKKKSISELKGSREMTINELINEIKKGKKSIHDKNWLYIELYKKFSIPFAIIAFTIIAIPLGLMTKKGGKIVGISISIVLIFIYYVLLSLGQSYGYRGRMNHFFAVWNPNFFMIGVGVILFIFLTSKKINRLLRRKIK